MDTAFPVKSLYYPLSRPKTSSTETTVSQSEAVFDLLEEAFRDVDLFATGLGEGL